MASADARRSGLRLLWAGLALLVAPIIASTALIGVQITSSVPELERSRAAVAHTLQVIATALDLRRAVRDAERGQRGFLITDDPSYLEPYRSGLAELPALAARLKTLTQDSPEQQRRMPLLASQLDAKLAEMQRTLDARERDGIEAARRIVSSNLGIAAMRTIDEVIGAVVATENAELADRQGRAAGAVRRFSTIVWVNGALILVALALGVAVVLRSFERLRAAERSHAGSADLLRRLVDGATDYAIYMLDPEGHVRTWNAGAERIKGYRADEIIGQDFAIFYTPEDRAGDVPRQVLETAAREGRYEAETWRVRKDGSRFVANAVIDAVRDERNRLVGFAKITRDVSDRALAASTLEQVRGRLSQAQKMDALGQLTGGVAHDFNNMLHVMLGSLETLRRHLGPKDPDALRQLDRARDGAERAAGLTRQLLAFTRQQALTPQPIDPNRLVTGMSDLLRRTLGEGIALETVLSGGMWWVNTDANQLESAILNLALNARDAMPQGGRLTIETGNTHLDEAYAREHVEVAVGQYAMIAVSDTGLGMTRETMEKAFDPFFTTKAAGLGTGLGLSQVFGFIKQSGGHVKLYSELGQGTTVKLYLPRHAGAAEAATATAEAPAAPSADRRHKILVVEDDELARTYGTDTLRELGYVVTAAPDGATALRLLDGDPAIVLLFTDVGLPGGMNGRQLAEAARARRPDLKVLYTTAYARNAIVHQGRLDPDVELLSKPFTYAELAAKMSRILSS